ncbi:MAG TPA: DUF1800 family protein, partial [Flavobacteriales bacterium]|nr:DUF1800 family protein [Flavobacteriales bacterium]
YWGLNGTVPDPSLIDPDVPFGSTWIDTVRTANDTDQSAQRVASFAYWRTGLMVEQQRNRREKLTLFWFNHMPNQVVQVFNPRVSYDYDQLLRTKCLGNFRELIYDVSTSGAMLIYLNGYLNTVTAPDENFGRELMELFTLGEGSGYTEEDVQAAARVLTGWTVREDIAGTVILPEVIFRPLQHNTQDKQFSSFFNNTVIQGQSGPNAGTIELNALLDMICAKEEVSRFICRELYRFFTHGEIDAAVETNVIEPLAQLFRDNAGAPDQMRTVVRALLTSDHFFSDAVRGCMIKSPVDLVVGALRQLGMPLPTTAEFEAQYSVWGDIHYLVAYCGQDLADPPNVAGWPAYYQYPQYDSIWMDTATYPARALSMQSILFNGFVTAANLYQPQSQNLTFKPDLLAVVAQFTDPYNPNTLVADATDMLFAVPVSQGVRDQLKTSYLLLGQQNDSYWSDAYELYVMDPNTTDMTAQLVPFMLLSLFLDMSGAAETQLH